MNEEEYNHPEDCNEYLLHNQKSAHGAVMLFNRSLEAGIDYYKEGDGEFRSGNINYCPVCGIDIRKLPDYYPVKYKEETNND